MATEIPTPAKNSAAPDEEVFAVELPAPAGWMKKFTPKTGGRKEIIFISPTGEEFVNKRQLDKYLRSHPGGPSSAEFDWGTGDTPRRSERLSAKIKVTETPEGEPPKKKERTSSSKRAAKGKKDSEDGENKAPEAVDAEANPPADEEMKNAEENGDQAKENAAVKGDAEEKIADGEKGQTDSTAPVTEEKKDDEKANAEQREDTEIIPPSSEQKVAEEEPGEKEKNDDAENHLKDSAVLPKTSEPPKEDVLLEKDSQPTFNLDDGQHQPKASSVNC